MGRSAPDGRDALRQGTALLLEELARRELEATEPTMGIIFPGMNDDVYLLSAETGKPGKATGFFNRVSLE